MNRLTYFLLILIAAVGFGCETVIQTNLDTGPAQLSVDGLLTDRPGPQRIRLTLSAAYFDNGPAPVASGATVTVVNSAGKTYSFTGPDNAGYYVWTPKAGDTLGRIGQSYTLTVGYQNQTYTARSAMNRVPPVDSIVFRRERITPVSSDYGYQSEFYVRDLPGAPDYYRIRYYKNDTLQNRPADIITVYDASFSNNANTDGLLFIQPLRQAANPNKFYALNDSVRIEILSLTADAYNFLRELRTQLTNTGLFARPATNVPTNIVNTNPAGPPATGYFMTCAVRGRTVRVSAENLRP